MHWITFATLFKINWTHLCWFVSKFCILLHQFQSVPLLAQHCPDYCIFIISFNFRKNCSSILLFIKIILAIPGPFLFLYKFRISLNISVNIWWYFDRILKIDTFAMLSLPIHKHYIYSITIEYIFSNSFHQHFNHHT